MSIQEALLRARAIPHKASQQRIVAICYNKRGKELSWASNSYVKTHPVQKRYAERAGLPEKQLLHAEIRALLRARADVYKIVVARVGASGKPLLAKPCPICEAYIQDLGVSVVEYSE